MTSLYVYTLSFSELYVFLSGLFLTEWIDLRDLGLCLLVAKEKQINWGKYLVDFMIFTLILLTYSLRFVDFLH